MERHTTTYLLFLFLHLGIFTQQATAATSIDTLTPDHQIHEIHQNSFASELHFDQLTIGQSYLVQFLVEDPNDCLPSVTMDIPFTKSREIPQQFMLDFVATKTTETVQLNIPCPNQSSSQFLTAIQCITCPNERKAVPRSADVIQAQGGIDEEFLIKDVFVAGGCYDVDNITYTGATQAKGTFSQGEVINVEEGIILATGNVANCSGPNKETNTTTSFPNSKGDQDLNTLLRIIGSTITNTQDAAVLEFDFTPTSDKVSFEYVWASEEYCDYSNSNFNDVFGFFISGPGIDGPFSNDGINIARLPNSETYVSINNINWQNNRQYYNNNTPGLRAFGSCSLGEVFAPAVARRELEYDGFTDVLTASVDVIPCETYHIKLALADVNDKKFDSAVFLKANSFKLGDPAELTTDIPNATFPDSSLVYESCQESYFVFKRTKDSDRTRPQRVPFNISDESTATPNVDYSTIPSPVTIPVGQDSVRVPVTIFADGEKEGPESIIFELESACTCEGIATQLTIIEPEEPDIIFDDLSTCPGGEVNITPQIEGGVGGYTFLWDNDATSATITPTIEETTTFTVSVTDECGTMTTASVTVETEPQTATLSGGVLVCNGDPTGQIEVNFTGSGPYSLEYEYNGETRNIANITDKNYILPEQAAGTYEAIKMTSLGCEGEGAGTAEIIASNINPTYRFESPKCHDTSDGFIEMTLDDDEETFTYNWNTGGDDKRIEGLESGDYQVAIRNELGCLVTQDFTLTQPEAIESSIDVEGMVNCYNPNGGNLSLNVSGGTPNYFYEWNNDLGAMKNPQNVAGGTYRVTITDVKGCESIAEATVLADLAEPTAVASVEGILSCTNAELTLSGDGSSEGDQFGYQWTTVVGTIDRLQSSLAPVVTEAGEYQLEVTDVSNGCTATQKVSVVADRAQPKISVDELGVLNCATAQQTINVELVETLANYTVEWTTEDGNLLSQTDVLSPELDAAGEYTLLITNNENGCSLAETFTVIEDTEMPEVTLNEVLPLTCTRKGVSISTDIGNENMDYVLVWETQDGNFLENRNTLNPSVDQAGEYILTVENVDNFCKTTVSTFVTIDTLQPIVDAGDLQIFTCDKTEINLTGTVAAEGNYLYDWRTEDGAIVNGENTLTPTIDEAGTYLLKVTNTVNNCESFDEVRIMDDANRPQVNIASPENITCANDQVTLDATSSTQSNSMNYRWETSSGEILDPSDPMRPVVGAAGTYQFFIVDESNGCVGKETVRVALDTVAPIAQISAPDVFNCSSEQINLDGSQSSTGNAFLFDWTTEDGELVSKPDVVSPTISSAGTYQLEVLDTRNGCSAKTTFLITEERPTDLEMAIEQPRCYGDKGRAIIYEVEGGEGPYTYSLDGGNSFTTESGFAYLTAGAYSLVVKDANDCELERTVTIVEPEELTVELMAEEQIDLGDSMTIETVLNIPDNQIAEVMWSNAEGLSCKDCLNPIAKPMTSTNYELAIIDQNGCEAQTSFQLFVDATPKIFVPNVFKPFGNQADNQRFTVFAKGDIVQNVLSLEVYNRWGETVFRRKNFQPNDPSQGWDGFFDRQKMKPAVFLYRVEVQMIDGRQVQLTGDFALVE
ncbi:MAG: choice-of-anchor L domain-containing protein [Bacteroidota bacterium]